MKNRTIRPARRRTGIVLFITGIVLAAVALSLFVYHMVTAQKAGDASDAALGQVLEAVVEEEPENTEMKVVWIDGWPYIGYLSVPSLGLELPVMSEWSMEGLEIAPGRYYGSVFSDDLVIAGHNYRRHFSTLKTAEEGTVVIFTDMNGNDYYYEISYRETVRPTEIDKMIGLEGDKDWDMTLFTCTTGGKARCAVRCLRTDR